MCRVDSGDENGVRRNCGNGGRRVGKIVFWNADLDFKDRSGSGRPLRENRSGYGIEKERQYCRIPGLSLIHI